MKTYETTAPDGKQYSIDTPDDVTEEQALARIKEAHSKSQPQNRKEPGMLESLKLGNYMDAATKAGNAYLQSGKDIGLGAIKGASRIGNTLVAGRDKLLGNESGYDDRATQIDQVLSDLGADKNSWNYAGGDLASQIAGTAAIGGVLGAGAKAAGATRVGEALSSGGGAFEAPLGAARDWATRIGAGGIVGGASAGLVNPNIHDVGIGSLLGGAFAPLAGAVSSAYKRIAGSSTGKAADFANLAAGSERDAAIAALESATPGITATQALADTNAAVLSSAGRHAQNRFRANQGSAIDKAQVALAEERLGNIAKTPAEYAAAKQEMYDVTNPMREEVERKIAEGNTIPVLQRQAGQMDDLSAAYDREAAGQVDRARRFNAAGEAIDPRLNPNGINGIPDTLVANNNVPGMPNVGTRNTYGPDLTRLANQEVAASADRSLAAGQMRDTSAARANTLRENAQDILDIGLKPLDSRNVAREIDSVLTSEGSRVSSEAKQVMGEISNKLKESKQFGQGADSFKDLYQIRKEEINKAIEGLLKTPGSSISGNTAKLARDIRNQIDASIEKSIGNTGEWKSYLAEYGKRSGELTEMQLGKKLLQAYKSPLDASRESSFGNAVRAAENQYNKRGSGMMIDTISPANRVVLQDIENEFARNLAAKKNADVGSNQLARMIGENSTPIHIPGGAIVPKATALNAISAVLSGRANKNMLTELARLAENPAELASAMREFPARDRAAAAKLMGLRYGMNVAEPNK